MKKNKKLFIAGNWKMNGLRKNSLMISNLIKYIKNKKFKNTDILICPPFTIAHIFSTLAKKSNLIIGAQNCSNKDSGPFTGDISPKMLKDIDLEIVILGHSERREYNNETSEIVKSKAVNALKNKLNVIICVGESLSQKKNGKTLRIIGDQLKKSLPDKISTNNLIVAYEPIWAIGSGLIPNNEDIFKVHEFISKKLTEKYGVKGRRIKILYGGSVNKKNAGEILSIDYVNGALVGGASLKYKDFKSILDFCN
tara:strand:+ start:81 stop:839 length:759 start_codon:yes stop_codon:yes gene_type:complete